MQAEEVEDRVENFFESAMDKAGDLTKVVADEPNIVPVEKKFQWYIFDVQIRDELTYHSVISNCKKNNNKNEFNFLQNRYEIWTGVYKLQLDITECIHYLLLDQL